jgi:ribosomal protein L37AE/L43A
MVVLIDWPLKEKKFKERGDMIKFWIRLLKYCTECKVYTIHIKDKEGWYCKNCGNYRKAN